MIKSYRNKQQGFTIIETMMVVSIVAIISALAATSFTPLIENWRIRSLATALQTSMQFSKSEAVKRGGQITIQKIANNTNGCTTAVSTRDWDCGWIVCHDINSNGTCNATEPVLQRIDANGKAHINRTGGGASIKFNRWGLVDGTWPGFTLVPLNKSPSHVAARGVCMGSGGRVSIISQDAIPCVN